MAKVVIKKKTFSHACNIVTINTYISTRRNCVCTQFSAGRQAFNTQQPAEPRVIDSKLIQGRRSLPVRYT